LAAPLSLNVKSAAHIGRVLEKPFFKKRRLFPVPPDNAAGAEIRALGLNPSLRHHNHSPGFGCAPNGDLLVSIYSSFHEYDAEVGLMGARLRAGAEEWDAPDIFINPVGLNDHAPLIYTTKDGTVYHFWGWQQLDNSFPFQYIYSKDSGATWSPVQFPLFLDKAERVVRQPINTCIEASDGYFYLLSDASEGSCSVLWRTKDMRVWENPKGRTAGRHSTAVELSDGRLLAMGGKNSDIDGFMPKAVSSDRGDTWEVSKTPFAALNSGQRPCIIRLESGLLFMCGDFQDKQGRRPAGETRWGSYAAYSADEGETWTIKHMWGAQGRKQGGTLFGGAATLGYCVARQSADGLIHVITSNNHPCLHFCFNEAWLLTPEAPSPDDGVLMRNTAGELRDVRSYEQRYPDGGLQCTYSGGFAENGTFCLHGDETWYYPSGAVMTRSGWERGERAGSYVYLTQDGTKIWEWAYRDGGELYRTYYKNGAIKSAGRYVNRMADGLAQTYGLDGAVETEVVFENGKIVKTTDLRRETASPVGELVEG
jgi:hypothetical protein